jgi:ribosomal protein L35AE/L33A
MGKEQLNGSNTRLYVKSVFLGFRRSRLRQNENQALLKI